MNLGEYIGAGSGTTKLLLHLNGNSTDSSGNGNNGTVNGATVTTNGKFGSCYDFDGTNDEIVCPSVSLTGNFTISIWVNPDALPATDVIMSLIAKYDVVSSNNTGYDCRLRNDSGIQYVDIFLGTGFATFTGLYYQASLPTSNWSNLLWVYNGSTIKLYLNGTEVASINNTANPANNTKQTYIGSFGHYTPTGTHLGRWFNGRADEIIIENRAWTASEIKKYYTNSKGRFHL